MNNFICLGTKRYTLCGLKLLRLQDMYYIEFLYRPIYSFAAVTLLKSTRSPTPIEKQTVKLYKQEAILIPRRCKRTNKSQPFYVALHFVFSDLIHSTITTLQSVEKRR